MISRFLRFLVSGWVKLPAVSVIEGLLSRLLFGAVVLYALRMGVDFHTEPHPVGLLKFIKEHINSDFTLTWLANPQNYEIYRWIAVAVTVVYVSGFALPVILPALAILHILPFTLFNSQGYTHHGNQIVSVTLIMQAITAIYAAIRTRTFFLPPDARFRSWLLVQSQVAITGCYFVSVVTKMDNSSWMWFWNSNYVAMDMVKTQRQSYLNKFEPEFQANETRAKWYMERPWTSRFLFSSGVLLETVCIFAIGNRLLGFLMGVSLIAMHRSIDDLMGLTFPNHEYLDAIFLVGIPFLLAWLIERIRHQGMRWGLIAGAFVGVPLSYLAQPEKLRAKRDFATYPLDVVNSIGYLGGNWDAERFFSFLTPVFIVCAVCAIVGCVLGRFVGKGKGGGEGRGGEAAT